MLVEPGDSHETTRRISESITKRMYTDYRFYAIRPPGFAHQRAGISITDSVGCRHNERCNREG